MKTNILKILAAFVGVVLIGCVLSNSLHAQTIISFDSDSEFDLVMKIQDSQMKEKPNKVILIFDSASISYDFSKEGEVALLTTTSSGASSRSSFYVMAYEDKSTLNYTDQQWLELFEQVQMDEKEIEEPMELENWMLKPNEWIN